MDELTRHLVEDHGHESLRLEPAESKPGIHEALHKSTATNHVHDPNEEYQDVVDHMREVHGWSGILVNRNAAMEVHDSLHRGEAVRHPHPWRSAWDPVEEDAPEGYGHQHEEPPGDGHVAAHLEVAHGCPTYHLTALPAPAMHRAHAIMHEGDERSWWAKHLLQTEPEERRSHEGGIVRGFLSQSDAEEVPAALRRTYEASREPESWPVGVNRDTYLRLVTRAHQRLEKHLSMAGDSLRDLESLKVEVTVRGECWDASWIITSFREDVAFSPWEDEEPESGEGEEA